MVQVRMVEIIEKIKGVRFFHGVLISNNVYFLQALPFYCEVEQLAARRFHSPQVAGSNPALATRQPETRGSN